MVPACVAIFSNALDGRRYVASGEIPEDEGRARQEARRAWSQLIHFIASEGWVKWELPVTGEIESDAEEKEVESEEEEGEDKGEVEKYRM